MPDPSATVFVVDDDASVRTALERLLRSAAYQVVCFPSAEAFIEREARDCPACLVLDVHLAGMDGTRLHARLRESHADLPVVFLTGHGDIPMGVEAMKRGAFDFLTKPVNDTALLETVDAAVAAHAVRREEAAARSSVLARIERLSPREFEVMRCILSGALNKQIAAHLHVVEQTVKVHRQRVMAKMEAKSVADLVRACELAGVSPEAVR